MNVAVGTLDQNKITVAGTKNNIFEITHLFVALLSALFSLNVQENKVKSNVLKQQFQ